MCGTDSMTELEQKDLSCPCIEGGGSVVVKQCVLYSPVPSEMCGVEPAIALFCVG